MLTDPVADMLTRIRNANKALQDRVEMPSSKLKEQIARILEEEGYIRGYSVRDPDELPYKVLVVELKYGRSRERVISGLKRVSKPGRSGSRCGSTRAAIAVGVRARSSASSGSAGSACGTSPTRVRSRA